MNWYDNYKDEWTDIIKTIARDENMLRTTVEKDAVQTLFLYEISKEDLPFVFKGGTSLSKAYKLINRFSEDIDLSMDKKPTESERRKSNEIILRIADKLGFVLENPDMIKTRYSYNKYIFKFDSLFSNEKQEIIIETSYYQKVYPVIKHKINSYVSDYLDNKNANLPFFFPLNFSMNVQTLERTFIDKVFAICDYKIQNMEDRDSRHLYDIAIIMPYIKIDNNLDELIDEVRDDRMTSKNNPSANLDYDINNMLKEIIDTRFYEKDYSSITKQLLYEDYSYNDAIDNGISKLLKTDVFTYKKIK